MAEKRKGVSEPFSAEQVDRVIRAVRVRGYIDAAKRAELLRKLNAAASDYQSEKNDPTPAQLRDRLRAVEKVAERLLNTLGAGQGMTPSLPLLVHLEMAADDLPEQGSLNTRSGHRQVEEALGSVLSLQRWAGHAATEIQKDIKPRGRSRNIARPYFLIELAKIYRWAFGRRPGVSRAANGKPGGPFVRFLDACFSELGEAHSLEAVAKWAKVAKKLENWDWGITRITTNNGRVLYSR